MRLLFLMALCAATVLRGPDAARADTPNFFLGPQIGTLGFGGEAGVRLNPFVAIRGGGNYFATGFDKEFTGMEYDAG